MRIHSLIASLLLAPSIVFAQANSTLTILVPFAPGGTVDLFARELSGGIAKRLDVSPIVENRGGAGGMIALGMLAKANPDGKTILFHHTGIVFDSILYKSNAFDIKKDIEPVACLGTTPNILVVTNSLPVKTPQEFFDYVKAHPNELSYGSGGVGSAGHLAMESFKAATGLQLVHVPYKGSGPAITDLIGGQVQVMLITMGAIKPFLDANSVRPLATSGLKRSPALQNIPTLQEAGVKNFSFVPWFGAFAPANTPPATLDKLNTVINAALLDPKVVNKLGGDGVDLTRCTRKEFASLVAKDLERWDGLISKMNISK